MRTIKIRPLRSSSRRRYHYYRDVLVTKQPVQLPLKSLIFPEAVFVDIQWSGELTLENYQTNQPFPPKIIFATSDLPETLTLQANTYSDRLEDRIIEINLYDQDQHLLTTYELSFTVLRICLDVDANRDGIVDENSTHKAEWKAGKDGYGAILLVNSDCDAGSSRGRTNIEDSRLNGYLDLKDCSLMVVRKVGPDRLPSGCDLVLSVDQEIASFVRVFDDLDSSGYDVIGPRKPEGRLRIRDLKQDLFLAVEGLHYPDYDFNGEIFLNLSLVKDREILYSDRIRFQVAPWLMTPHTLSPLTAYVLRTESGSNRQLIEDLRKVVSEANIQLEVVPSDPYRSDRWMQDEIEIGYSESPGHFMYVVLDSPRDRGLDDFPENDLLGTDFGHVTRLNEDATTLDSFGNLEVSPPVTVNGVEYPFGRILYGGGHPNTPQFEETMVKEIIQFLEAQKLQSPVELFSDWLSVGHIDEFMTFVPINRGKGFKLLLASPHQCYERLTALKNQGHGEVTLQHRDGKISINELLQDGKFHQHNQRFQTYIDWNQDILKEKLGLNEGDILHLPALFQAIGKHDRAETYFPNMVNMLVLDHHLAIPKPFGPIIDEACQFEKAAKELLEPLGFICHFIDDWEPYFLGRGEIHCGTNTRRQPFKTKWWEVQV